MSLKEPIGMVKGWILTEDWIVYDTPMMRWYYQNTSKTLQRYRRIAKIWTKNKERKDNFNDELILDLNPISFGGSVLVVFLRHPVLLLQGLLPPLSHLSALFHPVCWRSSTALLHSSIIMTLSSRRFSHGYHSDALHAQTSHLVCLVYS